MTIRICLVEKICIGVEFLFVHKNIIGPIFLTFNFRKVASLTKLKAGKFQRYKTSGNSRNAELKTKTICFHHQRLDLNKI